MGLLDQFANLNPQQTQGLLAAAAQMLQQSGPSRTPTSFGQALGGGLMAYQGSMAESQRRKQQEDEARQMGEMRGLQIQETQGVMADREASRKKAAHLLGLQQKYAQLGAPQQAAPAQGDPAQQPQQPAGGADPYQQAMGYARFLQENGLIQESVAAMKDALALRPKYSTTPQVMRGLDGSMRNVQLAEDGSKPVELAYGVKPDMVEVALGNRKEFRDKNQMKNGESFTVGVDPDTVYSGGITMRGQNMLDTRAREAATLARETGKAPTEFQGKSAAYGLRATEADKIISKLGDKFSPAAINAKQTVGNTWLVGGALEAAANKFALTENDQMAEQAQRDFINANLRQESGAAIAADEFTNAKRQYFPQPGDSAAVIAQKARNRSLAIQGLQSNAGRAALAAPAAPAGGEVKFLGFEE